MTSEQRPLDGLRVVDCGQYIAGPAAAMILADLGADVVHIDPPDGPRWKNPADSILNRGKRRIRVDLKSKKQLRLVRELIGRADVLIENFRPGVISELGLDPADLCEDNPALVCLSLPGFSGADEQLSNIPAWEAIVASSVGQYTDMGLNRVLMGINPSFSPLPMASAYAAVLGSMSVALALHARRKSGCGDIIEVPLSAALMEGLAYNSMQIEDFPDRYKSPRELEIERRRRDNQPMDLSWKELQAFLDPFYRTYVCKDGRPFYVVCSSHVRHPIACLKVLGVWEELRYMGIPVHDSYLDIADWPEGADCTLLAYPLSRKWADRVASRMEAAFSTKTAYEWEELFGAARVPGCAVQLTREWVRSEHALQSCSILTVENTAYGNMRQPGNLCWIQGDTRAVAKKPFEFCGTGAAAIERQLNRWEFKPAFWAHTLDPRPGRGWLDDVKILDLTNIIAGPTGASTLARFGASVIKIDPPTPSFDPWNTVVFGLQGNRGKDSMLLDLRSAEGRGILRKLLRDIDVVTINATDPQLERLGLTIEDLHRINPELILCQIDAFGGPAKGPRSDYPGYDDLVQATTGIMARFGGGLSTPEEHAHLGTIDVLCGYCVALSAGIALLQRARGSGGCVARSSLAAAGQLLQLPFMYDFPGRGPHNEPSGRDVKGQDALYRCYEASDGWLFLAVDRARKLNAFAAAMQIPVHDTRDESRLEQELETLFRNKPLAHWQKLLGAVDVGCQPLSSLSRVREQSLLEDSEQLDMKQSRNFAFIRYGQHPSGRAIELVAPNSVRPKLGKITVPYPARRYGADTVSVLEELGYSSTEINELLKSGAIANGWASKYLPE